MCAGKMPLCEFYLLRYVPNAVRGEFVNIGLVFITRSNHGVTEFKVRFTGNWSRVQSFDRSADLETLKALEAEIRDLLASCEDGPEVCLDRLRDSAGNSLQFSPRNTSLASDPD